jgi:3-hydroxybutyryl-CoA dehydrogenase
MARGIAVLFAYAGHAVVVIDAKTRDAAAFAVASDEALRDIRATLQSLARLGLFADCLVEQIAGRVSVVAESNAASALAAVAVIFECVPELVELKREVLARFSAIASSRSIIASTTSTILADDLADATLHPRRFLNSHYLNPAFLMPLVELSPSALTDQSVVLALKAILESVGKVPVVCAAKPGYIVPRIQALAMNEAARLVEEGVANATEIDKAIKYGFGIRFAVLGMLEFIDWGGGDILYYGSHYLTNALHSDRYKAAAIVEHNMRQGRIGLKTSEGFLDYRDLDIEAYRSDRLAAFVKLLDHFGMIRPPVLS